MLRGLHLFGGAVCMAAVTLAACNGDEPDLDEPLIEPQASIGEPIVYRGAVDTEEAWELTVTVQDVTCDVEIDDEVELAPGHDRFCVVDLHVENTGDTPNIEDFSRASTLLGDEQMGMASPVATTEYVAEQGLHFPIGIEPGAAVDTATVFDFPDDPEPLYLELQAGTDDPRIMVDLER